MRFLWLIVLIPVVLSCSKNQELNKIQGSWELQTGKIIKRNDTVITDYTEGQRLIKIINETHFSFLRHDLNKGKDTNAIFIAGGGAYRYDGKNYNEYLEFCTGRSWEGKEFSFQISIVGDTLVQSGYEKNEELGIDQKIIETYIRTKN
ncbi:hypothetical protein [Flavicella marina]|uniref:hypothetical protein n=1 Tax=Flavicella marina TaxID=1475951 RepID=UPI0012648139|nr:hypothetical protein [Flavicella marina]